MPYNKNIIPHHPFILALRALSSVDRMRKFDVYHTDEILLRANAFLNTYDMPVECGCLKA